MLPALIQTAATPSDPAKTAQVPLYCGRTKIFMTDSMVNWLGDELRVPAASAGPPQGAEEEAKHLTRLPFPARDSGMWACPDAGAVCQMHPVWLEATPAPEAGETEAGRHAHPGRWVGLIPYDR